MSDQVDISEADRLLTRLYQAGAEIGHQRIAAAESSNLAETAMLTALWNDCQLAIKNAHEDDKREDAESFLALIYSATE